MGNVFYLGPLGELLFEITFANSKMGLLFKMNAANIEIDFGRKYSNY